MEKQEARIIYFQIGRVWCPVLDDYVSFSSKGFRHLIRKGRLIRPDSEQERRFSLIPDAPKIINSAVTIAQHRIEMNKYATKMHGKKEVHAAYANFWSLKEDQNGKTITVIIRQSRGGRKYFLSIF
jgi:hypothetical protein